MLNKYKLYITWKELQYKSETTCYIVNPTLSGPAIKDTSKINDNDHIDLDITSQHIHLLGYWDIIRFSWNKVIKQTPEVVVFDYGTFFSEEISKVRLFEKADKLLIDTSDHDGEERHTKALVYKAVIVKDDNTPYKYDIK